ncbi:hypothetical protein ACFY4C_32825 [Actinomadura viridis]|uniref:hypothetical protein n=1 Tax=Actinomadura viridis TaxID=58110 RepID=UPI0036B96BF2
MAIEMDDWSPAVLERVAARAEAADRILVGVGDGPPQATGLLDLTFGTGGRASIPVDDPEAELSALADRVARNPQASLLLAQVLRVRASARSLGIGRGVIRLLHPAWRRRVRPLAREARPVLAATGQ